MDFFKSVFSEPTPTPSPPSSPNSENTPQPDSSWSFGSTLLKTIASKSESLLDNYYKDLQEFSSGLKKETSVIRAAASRAVEDLPARLESGAAIAQESLEAVGQAIDNVGSTVSEIVGKDLNFASNDGFSSAHLDESAESSGNLDKDYSGNAKPYSRIEAMIRSLQCNMRTYCVEVEESGYDEWRMGFRIEERREEIERLVEENMVIKEIYDEIVPGKVDEATFWCRYFYRAEKVVEAEETRARIVKRAISAEEEEELSWDVDEDGDNDRGGIGKDRKEKGKGVDGSGVENENVGVSGVKSDAVAGEEREGSDGKIGSDISIISSQRSSHTEDDLGWDEIEDIGSADERAPNSAVDLRKRVSSAAEEDEELSWDIEDDDEKS